MHNVLFIIAILINSLIEILSWSLPLNDSYLNFSHFHETIKHVINSRQLIGDDDLQCTIPPGAIIVTLGNQHYFPLLKTQLRAMELYEGEKYCLSKSFVTLCLDKVCYSKCLINGLLNCALLDTGDLPASDGTGHNAYGYRNYMKILVHREALKVANTLFFMEGDVIIYRNPFKTDFNRNNSYDFLFQRESASIETSDYSCVRNLNGGQYYFQKNLPVLEMLDSFITNRNDTIDRLHHGEQNFILEAADKFKVNYCSFPANLIAGHCHGMQSNSEPINATITYHVACVGGGYANKLEILVHHIQCSQMCGELFYRRNNTCMYCDMNILKPN